MFRFKRRDDAKYNLFRDLAIIVFSIAIGVMLIKTDVLANLFVSTRGMAIVGSFISGIFFVSIFTTVPATIALGEIARVNSLFVVALVGALGSVAGDMLIFRFVKNDISEDFVYLLKKTGAKRLLAIFQRRLFHWLLALLGA
ncbi:MAG TPA: hypothetical protein VMD74_04570, partial [Candidatus Methylomirabilis sp.]|nr:hypothetical protein [Candidatus Methylomirabilis sp.]